MGEQQQEQSWAGGPGGPAALGYGTPVPTGRPGVLTAVGVLSLVVSAITLMVGLIMGLYLFGIVMAMSFASRATPATVTTSSGGVTTTNVYAPAGATQPASQPAARGLTQAEVAAVIGQIETDAKAKLTPGQTQAITQVLSGAGQEMVTPGPTTQQTAAEVVYASSSPDGSVSFSTGGGFMMVRANGSVQTMSQFGSSTAGAGAATGMPSVPKAPVVSVAVGWALSMLLAVYLMVCGIFVFRQSPRARRLHLVYAWLKLPVAVLLWGSVGWLAYAFFTSVTAQMPGAGVGSGGWSKGYLMIAFPVVLACAYPIGLLVALNTRGVREYYGGGA